MTEEDPFELFKRTIHQFSSQSANFDPGQFGTLGWPMTPFPPGGLTGAEAVLSPEAGTKRAIRQLFAAIEQLDEMSFTSDSAQSGIWKQYLDSVPMEGFSVTDTPEQFGGLLIGTYQLWLYSLSQLLIESYTMRLVHDRLVTGAHQGSLRTQEWLWELPQSDREQLLMRCTDVDDDLVERMQAIRSRRNELLYDLGRWEEIPLDDPVGEARRYLHVLSKLDDLVSEGDGFDFFTRQRADDQDQQTTHPDETDDQ